MSDWPLSTHLAHLRHALTLAQSCPPTTTAFSVGAVLVSPRGSVLSTGYSRELPGNTHAEQNALTKLLPATPPAGSVLYTTMEPCSERLSGNTPCLDRILFPENRGITVVVVGVKEPSTFIAENVAERNLKDAGVEYLYVGGLEGEILEAATKGHGKKKKEEDTA
ncbi:cytidine deaminase-like protein [Sphaerosporella brunnea]|uniref:Cytidine deaminase-like protein n=1 Tax=Sphaerosporella brunnea TaxID=1250544 RepID=A0A5J5EIH4_9PEZI|nr:cytidine deaminase-like protein [Sphaerosporella brunnea]